MVLSGRRNERCLLKIEKHLDLQKINGNDAFVSVRQNNAGETLRRETRFKSAAQPTKEFVVNKPSVNATFTETMLTGDWTETEYRHSNGDTKIYFNEFAL